MPVITQCPDCSRKLRVPEELIGKKVRCPGCKVVFTAESGDEGAGEEAAAPPPAPRRSAASREERIEPEPRARRSPPPRPREEEDEAEERGRREDEEQDFEEEEEDDERPRGRRMHEDDEYGEEDGGRSRGKRAAWQKVASGITFHLISIGLWVLFLLCTMGQGFVIGFMAASSGAPSRMGAPGALASAGAGFFAFMIFLQVFQFALKGVQLYGHYLGMAVPDKPGSRVKSMAVGTFSAMAAGTGLTILSGILALVLGPAGGALAVNPMASMGGGMAAVALGGIGGICYFVGYIIFLLYLRGVALGVKRKNLASQAQTFLITSIAVGVVGFLLMAVATAVMGAAFFSVAGNSPTAPSPGAANAAAGGAIAIVGLTCVGGLVGLGLIIWYVVLLVQIRGAVVRYASRG